MLSKIFVYGFIASAVLALVLTLLGFTVYAHDAAPWHGMFVWVFFGCWVGTVVLSVPALVASMADELTRRHR